MATVASSLTDPFLLSTYACTQRTRKPALEKAAHPNAFATYAQTPGKAEGSVTVTTQGDGIHALDVSTLRPLASHSAGSSTIFSCPAISHFTSDAHAKLCQTYAVIEGASGNGTSEDGCKTTLTMWTKSIGTDRLPPTTKSVVAPSKIVALHAPDSISSRIISTGSDGHLAVLDLDLNVKHRTSSFDDQRVCFKAYAFSRNDVTFVPTSPESTKQAIIILFSRAQNLGVHLYMVDESSAPRPLGFVQVSESPDDILDVTCSESGYISLLYRNGDWHSYQIQFVPADTAVNIVPTLEPLKLTNLAFTTSKAPASQTVSILAIRSSFVLLAGLSQGSNPEIIFLLWDLRFSVLLASHSFDIPSSLGHSKTTAFNITLSNAASSQVLLVLSPHFDDSTGWVPSSSSIFIVPFTAPASSTIANAIGKLTENSWAAPAPKSVDQNSTQKQLLRSMKQSLEKNDPQAANKAFTEWFEREKQALSTKELIVHNQKGKQSPRLIMDFPFVRDILLVVLQPLRPTNAPYSPEVTRFLLEHGKVSSSMFENGLLRILLYRGDWSSIELSLDKVLDLTEEEIMATLKVVCAHTSAPEGIMEVDNEPSIPTLSHFLDLCVRYPTKPLSLRTAIRNHIQNPGDLLLILQIMEQWLDKWSKNPIKLLPNRKELNRKKNGASTVALKEVKHKDLPPVEKIVNFLQTTIDASFVVLLQQPAVKKVIRSLLDRIDPEILFSEHVEHLRGSLEPYVKAQKKLLREAAGARRKEPQRDWRQRKKEAHNQANMGIGSYRLEELVL